MIDFVRSRNRAAVAVLLSLTVFLPALVLPRTGDDLTVRKLILFFSLGSLLISTVWLIVRWDETRRLMRLRAGVGVLARWTADRARWERFRVQSHEWDQREDLRPNDVNLAQDPGDTGIEIVVTRDGILIGKDFRPLEPDVRITARADWMEYYQIITKPKGPALHMVLRVPLQAGLEHLAAEVQQSYQRASRGAAASGKRQIVMIGLFILIGLPLVTVLIWLIATGTGWVQG